MGNLGTGTHYAVNRNAVQILVEATYRSVRFFPTTGGDLFYRAQGGLKPFPGDQHVGRRNQHIASGSGYWKAV